MDYYEEGGAKTVTGAKLLTERYLSRKLGEVLDIGCGSGAMLEALSSFSTKLTGIDSSLAAVALTKTKLNCEVLCADVERGLPFMDGSFDTVLLCDILEHLRSPVLALSEAFRVLRTGGTVFITTPNANSPMRRLRGEKWFALADPSHLIFFTAFSLSHLVKKSGFRVELQAVEATLNNRVVDNLFRFTKAGGTLVLFGRKP